jgi:hypothetical protein
MIAGLAALLMVVAFLARKRSGDRKMAALGGAFAAAAAGGVALTLGELIQGAMLDTGRLVFEAAMLASLGLLYAALFARAR